MNKAETVPTSATGILVTIYKIEISEGNCFVSFFVVIVLNEPNPHLCCQEQFHLRNSLNMLIESVVVMLWKLLYHGCQVGFKNVVILPQKAEYFVFVQMLLCFFYD